MKVKKNRFIFYFKIKSTSVRFSERGKEVPSFSLVVSN